MNVLNMVIPILMHILTFICQRHSILHQNNVKQLRQPITSDIAPTVYQNILMQILDIIQSDVALHSQVH